MAWYHNLLNNNKMERQARKNMKNRFHDASISKFSEKFLFEYK
jgi:hypothetical protein